MTQQQATTKSWDDVGGSGDISVYVPPDIADGLYEVKIIEVGAPQERPDFFDPNTMKVDFYVQFDFVTEPEGTELRYYVTIPEGWLTKRKLSKKSNLYELMDVLGLIDPDAPIVVDPPSWEGLTCRALVKQHEKQDGTSVPKISELLAAENTKPARRATPAAQRTNGAARPARKPAADDWPTEVAVQQ